MPAHGGLGKVVACIPAYNEERTIARVVLTTKKYVDTVIVCDDGSTDLTGEIASALGAIVVRHDKNMGVGAALRTLFDRARELGAEIVVTLDADGQHDPSYIPDLVEPILRREADLVIGSRFVYQKNAHEVPLYRKIGIKTISGLAKRVSKLNVRDTQSGFRAYSRRALEVIQVTRDDFGWSLETLDQAASHGLKVVEVPVPIRYKGVEETSTKNPLSHGLELIRTLLDLVTWKRPLAFLGIPGVALLGVAAFFMVNMLSLFNRTRYFSLPMTLLATAFGLAGMTMLSTAVMLYAIQKALLSKKPSSRETAT